MVMWKTTKMLTVVDVYWVVEAAGCRLMHLAVVAVVDVVGRQGTEWTDLPFELLLLAALQQLF